MLRASSIDVAVASSLDMVAGDFDVLARRAGTRLISANAREGAYAFEASALRIAGDVRILFVGLTAPLPVPSSTWSVSDPVAALREVLEKPHGADVVVLLSDLGPGETRRVVRAVPGVDFALVGGHAEDAELTDHVETTESGVRILQLHREGRFVGRLELVPGEGPGFVHVGPPGRAEAEWLGHRARDLQDAVERYLNAPDAAARRAEVEAARRALADDATHLLGRRACPTGRACFEFTAHAIEWSFPQHAGNAALLRKWLDVDLPGLNCRPGPITEGPAFAGATACAGCHDDTVKDWAGTPHAHAWSTLEQRRATCDVGCIDCHTTGFRRPGGFDFTEQGEPAGLTNVQCEACHGPAAAHAEDDAVPMSLAADRATCVTCHNRKHSPSFHFETYRARLLTPAHGGKP